MKIGASTLSGYKDKLENNLEYFESIGLDYAEILHQYPNQEINTEILDTFNLKYTIHSPIININIASLNEGIRNASISEVKKSIDLANKIGSDIVVVHPGSIPFLGKDFEEEIYDLSKEAIIEIGEYGEDLGVNATIENMPNIEGYIYKDIIELDNLLQTLEMNMTLDIGHAYNTGFSPDEMYFDSIKHIHISDNNGDYDSHYALGEGLIDFKQCISKFQDKNYKGIYMIEVNSDDSVKKSLEYLKKL